MKGGVGSSSPTRRSSSEKRSFERRETERAAHTVRVLKGIAERKAADVEAKKVAQEVAAAAKKAAETAVKVAKETEKKIAKTLRKVAFQEDMERASRANSNFFRRK